jgi:hypothetical protein
MKGALGPGKPLLLTQGREKRSLILRELLVFNQGFREDDRGASEVWSARFERGRKRRAEVASNPSGEARVLLHKEDEEGE